MANRIKYIFLGLGVVVFLLATGFLTKTSETALVNGAMGLAPLTPGAVGAHIGRRSMGRAIGFGIGLSVLGLVLLITFFSVIWPML